MGKSKSLGTANVPNRHLHSRISYLYQAATYLSNVQSTDAGDHDHAGEECLNAQDKQRNVDKAKNTPLSRLFLSQLHDVSRKGQVRLSPNMKRTICRRCHALLQPGHSATMVVENPSRGGKKPWADLLVVQCNACGAQKRFPVGMTRQPGRCKRGSKEYEASS